MLSFRGEARSGLCTTSLVVAGRMWGRARTHYYIFNNNNKLVSNIDSPRLHHPPYCGECLLGRVATRDRARRPRLFFAPASRGARIVSSLIRTSRILSAIAAIATANGKRLTAEQPQTPAPQTGVTPRSAKSTSRNNTRGTEPDRVRARAVECPGVEGGTPETEPERRTGGGFTTSSRKRGVSRRRPTNSAVSQPGDFPAEPGHSLGHPAVREPDRRPWFVECNKRACKA